MTTATPPQVRDPKNVPIWVDANVWASTAATATQPATVDAAFDSTWNLVGILDGKAGFSDDRKWVETNHFGWGIGLFKVSHSQFELTRTFTAFENNATTRNMLWPGSTSTALLVPRPASLFLAFETNSETGGKERLITRTKSQVWVPKLTTTEADITSLAFTCRVFADGTGTLFDRQISAVV